MARPHAVPVAVGSPVGEALASRAPGGDLRGSQIPGSALPRCHSPAVVTGWQVPEGFRGGGEEVG